MGAGRAREGAFTFTAGAAAHDGQYNAQRVAQDLIDVYGAEEGSAAEAGRVVQQQALDRAMRRNVQRFLRERDEVWSASAEFTGATTNGALRDASEVQAETITNSDASEQIQRSRGLAAVLEELRAAESSQLVERQRADRLQPHHLAC